MEQKEYSRYLSKVDVWALSLGCIIGWGAFVMPGTTFLPVAGPAGTVIAILVSAAIMLVIGLNYAYLMAKQPGIGGVYAYTKGVFGRDHAFISSWFLCLAYLSLIPQNATALTLVGRALFGHALQQGAHYQLAGYEVYLTETACAIFVLVIIAVLAIFCKRLLQWIQTGFGILLLMGVVIISAAALPHVNLKSLFESFGTGHPLQGIFTIVMLAPWAFVGFEVVSLETAHFKFQIRKSKWLIGIAILIGGFMYVSMTVIAASVIPDGYESWQAYIADLGRFSNYAAIPTFNAARTLIGETGLVIMGVTVISAIVTSVIGFYRASARILANMAEDHILTQGFERPSVCFIFVMVVSILLSLFGRNVLGWVVDLSSFGAIVGFGYTSAAAYRTAKGEQDRRMAALGVCGIVASVIFGLAQLIPYLSSIEAMDAESYMLLALWCLLGFQFYWRTMTQSTALGLGSEHVTISSLFTLLFYSALIWYVKTVMREQDAALLMAAAGRNAIILCTVVILGLCIMLLIHTRLRKRQVALDHERIHAIEGSKAKSQFLFNMSHDIRTPMNAIMGFTHLGMKEDLSAEEKDAYLKKIDRSGQQLLSIINDVLDMSRIENDRIELDPVPTDLAAALEEMRDVFSTQMEEKRIHFTVDTAGVEDRWVLCDKNRFSRVVLNLLSNACKFTPEDGRVSVVMREVHRTRDYGDYELRVRDSGIGISEAFKENLFKPFERERTSTVSGIQGTGLGMSITKGIVDLMGGIIEVFTEPGKGTEFIVQISFPIVEAPSVQPVEPKHRDVDLSRIRALLVEDNAINMEIATMILEQAGITVEKAENGLIAVQKVKASRPGDYDLILMDIQMPEMDGYTATREIRSLDDKALASLPIIAMTANAFAEDIRAAEEAGMDGHIAKPIDVNTMLGTITEALSKHEA